MGRPPGPYRADRTMGCSGLSKQPAVRFTALQQYRYSRASAVGTGAAAQAFQKSQRLQAHSNAIESVMRREFRLILTDACLHRTSPCSLFGNHKTVHAVVYEMIPYGANN